MAEGQINLQVNQPNNVALITAQEFGAKFQSKREVYRFLSSECGVYLPSYETGKWWWLSSKLSIFLSEHLPLERSLLWIKEEAPE